MFKLLFEGYIFEEHMMFSIPGRKINLNPYDQSSIYNSKSVSEIQKRLEKSYRRVEIFPMALSRTPAFKLPEVALHINQLLSYYPDMKTIIMLRHPESVISSMLERGWFNDKELFGNSSKWFFLAETACNGNTPDWLYKSEVDKFYSMSEIERCSMYYKREYESILNLDENILRRKNTIILDYNRFVTSPQKYFDEILEQCSLKYGDITPSLLEKIKEPTKDRKLKWDLVDTQIKSELFALYDKCLTFSL
jgi:hypothetical protein